MLTKISEERARQISPVTLAFVGDAVYSLYVREREVLRCDGKLADLQKRTSVEELFTPTEEEIFHRGRNAKKSTKAKNASVIDYNRSTGFEAVLGFLYLTGQYERIAYIIEGGNA